LSGLSQSWCARGSVELTLAPGLPETSEEERMSYLRNLQRHAAMEYGEVPSAMALKPGVGDHTPERFADHEPRRNANHGFAFGPGAMNWKTVKRLHALN